MNRKPNTQAVVRLAVEKSEQARKRTREAIQKLRHQGKTINFSTVCEEARVSKTFLYDPRHADLAEEIRRLRELPTPKPPATAPPHGKSESAKDAQIARLKEHPAVKIQPQPEDDDAAEDRLDPDACVAPEI